MMSKLRGIALIEIVATLLLVALFLTTAYTMLVEITNFISKIVDPMPVYSLLSTRMNTIKKDINDSLLFKVEENQIHYILKNGQRAVYDFNQFNQWFSPKYQSSATVIQTQANNAIVTWQFTTSRNSRLYGTTVLKKVTQAVPVPKEIISTSGGVIINLYNPAVGIGTASSISAQVNTRYANAAVLTTTASLINKTSIAGQNIYYSVFVSTATKPVAISLPSLYGVDNSYTYPVEVLVP